ncbi:hypothetical protein EMPS_10774 [Entomortierella parvispora]|uniref:Secreted protein n=1 Tax=Entomortierella parvispora TaxID=205924 RepID=A0A9P3M1V4_9FUNG|nr:hypothetical protein EMPS_10774 [Entomortierella parvispora]
MSSFSRSFFKSPWIAFLVAAAGLCMLAQSQAVCIIQSSYIPNGMVADTCAYNLPDCSTITSETLMSNYALKGVTVQVVTVPGATASLRIAIAGMETYMVKAVLAPQLLGCYINGKPTMTVYNTNSASA